MIAKIESLTRYPVKGLSGQTLQSVQLEPGKGFPSDRQFGFARPNSGFDPNNPKPLPKSKFYMLARDAALALLHTEFNDNTGELSITSPDSSGQFDITTSIGQQQASQFLQSYLALPDDETPHLFEASPHRFTDVSVVSTELMNAISIINIDSITAFSKTIDYNIDPGRFRGNILVSGIAPFSELDLIGKQIKIGSARLNVVMRTKRCPATKVNLSTGERDLDTPALLQKHYQHKDMGIYAEVAERGTIAPGDTLKVL